MLAPASVTAMERDGTGANLTIDDGRVLRCSLVVACDGAMSGVRTMAGIGHRTIAYGQTGIVCTVEYERDHRGIAHERFLPGGPFAILPVPGNRSSLVWTEKDAIAQRVLQLEPAAFLEEIAWRFGDFLGDLKVTGPVWSYPLTLVLAHHATAPRLVLVGDAAHRIHPIAGQATTSASAMSPCWQRCWATAAAWASIPAMPWRLPTTRAAAVSIPSLWWR